MSGAPSTDGGLLTTAEVAAACRKSVRTVHRLVADGLLQPIRMRPRAQLLFRADDVARLLGPDPDGNGGAVEPDAGGTG